MNLAQPKNASPPTRRRFDGSRLQQWLDMNGFTSAELEKVIGMSRQSMTQIRGGRDVRLKTAIRILRGCRSLAKRKVEMHEIFDLDPDSPANAI